VPSVPKRIARRLPREAGPFSLGKRSARQPYQGAFARSKDLRLHPLRQAGDGGALEQLRTTQGGAYPPLKSEISGNCSVGARG